MKLAESILFKIEEGDDSELPASLRDFRRLDSDDNYYYKELERFRRHDHGGGDNGDDWLPQSEIDKDYQAGVKKHKRKLGDVNDKLKEAGFMPNAKFELGEKGHFSIYFELEPDPNARIGLETKISKRTGFNMQIAQFVYNITRAKFGGSTWSSAVEVSYNKTNFQIHLKNIYGQPVKVTCTFDGFFFYHNSNGAVNGALYVHAVKYKTNTKTVGQIVDKLMPAAQKFIEDIEGHSSKRKSKYHLPGDRIFKPIPDKMRELAASVGLKY